MKTYYKDKLLSSTSQTYNSLTDKPVINGFELVGNASAENLGTYNKPTLDRLLENVGNLVIDSSIPTPPAANTLYYIGNMPPFEVYLSDSDSNLAFLGLSSSQNFQSSSEGIEVITSEGKSLIKTKHDSSFRILNDKSLSAKLVDIAADSGLVFLNDSSKLVGVDLDHPTTQPFGIKAKEEMMIRTALSQWDAGLHGGYFQFNFGATQNMVIKMRITIYQNPSGVDHIIMCSPTGSANQFALVFRNLNQDMKTFELGLKMGVNGELHKVTNKTFESGTTYDIEYGNNYIKVNGEEVGRWAPEIIQPGYPMQLFDYNNWYFSDILRISVYEDDVLVHDFVPMLYRLVQDGLYDLIDEKFTQGINLTTTGYAEDIRDVIPDGSYMDSKLTYTEDMSILRASVEDESGAITPSIKTVKGLVPAPNAGDQNAFLRDDGLWDSAPSDYMVGEIRAFAGPEIPAGWLLCDGSVVSQDKYRRLYSVIGNSFLGKRNSNSQPTIGLDEFMLPDLRQRFIKMATKPKNNLATVELPMAPAAKYTVGPRMISPAASMSDGPLEWGPTKTDTARDTKTVVGQDVFSFDLSKMSPVYQYDIHTVQPDSVVVQYIIKY